MKSFIKQHLFSFAFTSSNAHSWSRRKKMKNTIIGDSIVSRADGEYRIFLNSNKDMANFYSFKNLLNLNLITKFSSVLHRKQKTAIRSHSNQTDM